MGEGDAQPGPVRSGYFRDLPGQLTRAGVYLAIIAVLHYTKFLVLMPTIRWTLVGVILVGALVPVRWSAWASAAGFLAVGGVSYFHYGNGLMGVLCAGMGAVSLFEGVAGLRRGGRG